ncbi:DNA-directed RNA polymerase subunit alpha C-terminal domain-containing protein [Planctomycetota bacterium]
MEAVVDFVEVLSHKGIDHETLDNLRSAAFATEPAYRSLRLLMAELGEPEGLTTEQRIKRGFALHLLGKTSVAIEELTEAQAQQHPIGACVLGWCYLALDEARAAADAFAAGLRQDKTNLALQLGAIEAERRLGKPEAALKQAAALRMERPDDQHVLYQIARATESLGQYDEAMDTYEEVLGLDPDHTNALFRLAFNHEQRGSPLVAVEYYGRIANQAPTYVNAIVNNGLILEDLGRYEEAIELYRRVLRARPSHERALRFLKDAEASIDMYYDEDMEKRSSRRNAILRIPVTDFELSVRARNCLNKMNIRNLGDLVTKTEEELLAYKNFGETSLHEIKQMLAQKGLRLGMFRDGEEVPVAEKDGADPARGTAGDEEILKKAVSELELSVRARNCMERLNIRTIGELIERSEAELLAVKNFGQTSLNEVKQRLAEHGLTLRS